MRIEFTVQGLPPKKHGELSMYNKSQGVEVPRVLSLRKAALAARHQANLSSCINTHCKLEVTVYIQARNIEAVGDLDSFVAGICDSLQAASQNVWPHLHESFLLREHEVIHPRYHLLIDNDAKIMTIYARKLALSAGEDEHYHVVLDTEI